uniref:Uncharacterized protein n=1 Tax=Anguilla anguilla TaxID=7936 RepID=A0A0E9W8P0_ANGAN
MNILSTFGSRLCCGAESTQAKLRAQGTKPSDQSTDFSTFLFAAVESRRYAVASYSWSDFPG